MVIVETKGSRSYVQCFSCKNAPILPVVGDKKSDLQPRLEATATQHESRHPNHRVTLYVLSPTESPLSSDIKKR